MRKALITFGTGDSARTLVLARATFERYAARHGYDLLAGVPDFRDRPPSWGKVTLLQQALERYDFALWVDADAMIMDASLDVESEIPAAAYQGFVTMPIGPGGEAGVSPCCGVWALRAGDRAQRFLAEVWGQTDLVDHQWWEQAAVMRLLGWRLDGFPVFKERRTGWDDGLCELPGGWDVIPNYPWPDGRHRIRHYAGESTQRRLVEMGTDLAQVEGRRMRHALGVCHRRARRFPRVIAMLDALLT